MTLNFLNAYLWCLKMKNQIKSMTGIPYGWTEDSFGDTIKAYNKFGKLVGEYRKSSDTTCDDMGRPIYKGNALAYLIIKS